jgi:hypothetical protein
VGQCAGRPAAAPINEEERFTKFQYGRCMKPLSESVQDAKAVNKGTTYWVCAPCIEELRACGGQDSRAWRCPTARDGKDGCKCCADAKKRQVSAGKRPRRANFSSSKKQKVRARQKNESKKGNQ